MHAAACSDADVAPRRARVSRNERGGGFDADEGFTIIEVVVASTLLIFAFLAAARLFEEGDARLGRHPPACGRRAARVGGDREGPGPGRESLARSPRDRARRDGHDARPSTG